MAPLPASGRGWGRGEWLPSLRRGGAGGEGNGSPPCVGEGLGERFAPKLEYTQAALRRASLTKTWYDIVKICLLRANQEVRL
jgi:hypothetical protein